MSKEVSIIGKCPCCGDYIWGLPDYEGMEDIKCANPECAQREGG